MEKKYTADELMEVSCYTYRACQLMTEEADRIQKRLQQENSKKTAAALRKAAENADNMKLVKFRNIREKEESDREYANEARASSKEYSTSHGWNHKKIWKIIFDLSNFLDSKKRKSMKHRHRRNDKKVRRELKRGL